MSRGSRLTTGALLLWGAVILLAVLHQDCWNWDDRRLIFGFMPITLLYHALYSLSAATVWAIALKVVWPSHLEEWAEQTDAPAASVDGEGR